MSSCPNLQQLKASFSAVLLKCRSCIKIINSIRKKLTKFMETTLGKKMNKIKVLCLVRSSVIGWDEMTVEGSPLAIRSMKGLISS